MIIVTLSDLNAQPPGTIVFDQELEMYLKRDDGRWAYPANNPRISSIPANGMMKYGPLQVLEVLAPAAPAEANGLTDLQNLPPGAVVLGRNLARKRADGDWDIAGKQKSWKSSYLLTHEYATLPMKVLHL